MERTCKIVHFGICILAILFIAFCIGSVVIASSYSVLGSDDFSHAYTLGISQTNLLDYLSACFRFAGYIYMNWQGTYFSMFLQALLSPLNGGGMPQLRIVMVLNSVLFFTSVLVLVFTVLKNITREIRYLKLSIVAVIFFMITGYEAYEEVFFWFSGAASYSFPLSLLLFAISLAIQFNRNPKPFSLILSCLLGFLTMGGSLTVAGTGCYILLLLIILDTCKKRYLSKENCILFAVWFSGALLNAIAPGNYIRHDVIDSSGVHPLKALLQGCLMVHSRYQNFFAYTDFVALIILMLMLGIFLGKKTHISCETGLFAISIAGMFTPVVTAFPVALGFSSQEIPNRCSFLIDISIIFSASFFSIMLGILLEKYCCFRRESIVLLVVILFSISALDAYPVSKIKNLQIASQIVNGTYQSYNEACSNLVSELNKAPQGGDIVILSEDYPRPIENIYPFLLTTDPDYWINKAVARYYGFNTLSVQSSE